MKQIKKYFIIIIMVILLLSLNACTLIDQQEADIIVPVVEDKTEFKYNSEDKICQCLNSDRLEFAEDKLYEEYNVVTYDKFEELDINVFNFIVIDLVKNDDGAYERKEKVYGIIINLGLLEDCHQSDRCLKVIYEDN